MATAAAAEGTGVHDDAAGAAADGAVARRRLHGHDGRTTDIVARGGGVVLRAAATTTKYDGDEEAAMVSRTTTGRGESVAVRRRAEVRSLRARALAHAEVDPRGARRGSAVETAAVEDRVALGSDRLPRQRPPDGSQPIHRLPRPRPIAGARRGRRDLGPRPLPPRQRPRQRLAAGLHLPLADGRRPPRRHFFSQPQRQAQGQVRRLQTTPRRRRGPLPRAEPRPRLEGDHAQEEDEDDEEERRVVASTLVRRRTQARRRPRLPRHRRPSSPGG
mmetsp:Transcript_30614/g.93569  ORF Transcript_30614/g.93569 Transcript_30614/m.93569 type:complete len:274 (+) Transcript_30614:177-998(+)